jgi:hypothetical protein
VQPDGPRLHAADGQHRIRPWIGGKATTNVGFVLSAAYEQGLLAVDVAHWTAEDNDSILGQAIHECRMLIPACLLTPRPRPIPRRTAQVLDQEIVSHAASLASRRPEIPRRLAGVQAVSRLGTQLTLRKSR